MELFRNRGAELARLAKSRFTGRLGHGGYSIAFSRGEIVDATSPLLADSIARIALFHRIVTRAAITDDVDLPKLVEIADLGPKRVAWLAGKIVQQRAARTFALDCTLHTTAVDVPRTAVALDVRAVVFHGAATFVPEHTLPGELRAIGSRFKLVGDASAIAAFEFPADAWGVIDSLVAGISIPELELLHRTLDPRLVHAIVYALVSCGACEPISEKKRVAKGTGEAEPIAKVELRRVTRSMPPVDTRSTKLSGVLPFERTEVEVESDDLEPPTIRLPPKTR